MSNFASLNTSLTGIRAAQIGLDTASHNVANANTPGYTRQRVDLTSRSPYWSPVGPVGTGVDVADISRTRDQFLDARVRTVAAEFSWHDTTSGLLGRTEAVLGEPDNGISEQVGALWDAFEDLGVNPDDGASRQQVVVTLEALAGRVRAVDTGWAQLERDTGGSLEGTIRETNDLLAQVADLNRKIGDLRLREGSPNDLYDQRDLALDRLASLIGATIAPQANGDVTVSLVDADGNAVALVEGQEANLLEVSDGGRTISVAGGGPVDGRGEAFSQREFLATELPARQAALGQFVADLMAAVNTRHADGYDSYGDAGGDLFVLDAAGGLRVAPGVAADPRRLAAASEQPVANHDGRNADRLAGLRTEKIGGSTLDDRVKELIVNLAAGVSNARRSADAQASLSAAATVARQGVHGVSIDEEMVSVVQYQRALEAASRVMTAVDQALDQLINRTGIVGR